MSGARRRRRRGGSGTARSSVPSSDGYVDLADGECRDDAGGRRRRRPPRVPAPTPRRPARARSGASKRRPTTNALRPVARSARHRRPTTTSPRPAIAAERRAVGRRALDRVDGARASTTSRSSPRDVERRRGRRRPRARASSSRPARRRVERRRARRGPSAPRGGDADERRAVGVERERRSCTSTPAITRVIQRPVRPVEHVDVDAGSSRPSRATSTPATVGRQRRPSGHACGVGVLGPHDRVVAPRSSPSRWW